MDVSVELRLLDSLSGPARQAFGQFRAAARQAGAGFGGLGREAAAAGQAVDRLGASARAAGEATADMGRDGSLRRTAGDAHDAARGMDAVSRSGRRAGDALRQAEAQAGRLRRTLDGVGRGLQSAGRVAGGLRDAGAAAAAAGMVGAAALVAPVKREGGYLYDATVAFNDRDKEGILAGVAELRALDQRIAASGGGTLDSARAMRGAFMAGGVAFEDVARLAPLTQRAATAAGAEGADFANTLMAGAKSGQFSYADAEKVFGMLLTAGASGSFETRDMAQYLPGIFNATGDMRGLGGTARHLAGLETIRDATGDSAEAANRYQNLLSFRNSKEAYGNLSKKGINLAHVYRDAAKKGEDMNLAFVGAIQSLVERNKDYTRLKKELAGATGARANEIRNQMGAIQNRIFSEIIGDQQARQGAIALVNGRSRYDELLGDITRDPETMIDKLFSVMTSSTQANLDRLTNEWEKGMDRVLEVVKGPLEAMLRWVTGLMADNPQLTAGIAGLAAAGGAVVAGKGALGLLRMAGGGASRLPAALAGTSPGQAGPDADGDAWEELGEELDDIEAEDGPERENRRGPRRGRGRRSRAGSRAGRRGRPRGDAAGQGRAGRMRPRREAPAMAGAGILHAARFGLSVAETEGRDDLGREQKNEAHAGELGALAGGIAGAKAGAAMMAWAGPVGAAVGAAFGAAGGSLLGSELGRAAFRKAGEALDAVASPAYDAGDPEAMQDRFRQLAAQAEAGKGPVQRPDAVTEFFAGLRDEAGGYWDALFGGGQARPAFTDTGEGLEERLAALAQRDADTRRQDSPEEWQARLEQAVQAAAQAAAQAQPLRVELHSTLELDGSVLASTVEERMIREAARR